VWSHVLDAEIPREETASGHSAPRLSDIRRRRASPKSSSATTFPDTYKRIEVELLCIAEHELSDGAWVKAHFFEDNIASWRRIDAAVRNLVESFRR
jgi:hypothetical protein